MAEETYEAAAERKPMTWTELLGELKRTLEATMGASVPPEFWQHARAAHKEHLLALRSLIDARIACIEAKDEEAARRKPTKITVQ